MSDDKGKVSKSLDKAPIDEVRRHIFDPSLEIVERSLNGFAELSPKAIDSCATKMGDADKVASKGNVESKPEQANSTSGDDSKS